MARRAPTAEEARKPIKKRKDIARGLLDEALWQAVSGQTRDPGVAAEMTRQIKRIHKMWGWTSGG